MLDCRDHRQPERYTTDQQRCQIGRQDRKLYGQRGKQDFGQHQVAAPDGPYQPILADARNRIQLNSRCDQQAGSQRASKHQHAQYVLYFPPAPSKTDGGQERNDPMHRRHQQGERPHDFEILFEDMPDHELTPFRAARANATKMDRSGIGCASMYFTSRTSTSMRERKASSENCVSTNVRTFPLTLISSHWDGKSLG